MVDLFNPLKNPKAELKQSVVGDELERDQMADRQRDVMADSQIPQDMGAGSMPSPRDQLEQNYQIFTPSEFDTPYHKKVVKDMGLSQIGSRDGGDTSELRIMERYHALINNLTYYGLVELAQIYHAEMLGRLALLRSVGGFQQEMFRTTNVQTRKVIQVQDGSGKPI